MDKRPPDHIENRFRQAADNMLPPQNEEAWKRMEALLDKDPDRRKPFIWWWMFGLLLLGLGTAGIYHYWGNAFTDRGGLKEKRTIIQADNKPAGEFKKNDIDRQKSVNAPAPENRLGEKEEAQKTVKESGENHVSVPTGQSRRKVFSGSHGNSRKDKLVVRQHFQTGISLAKHNRFKNAQSPGRVKEDMHKGVVQRSIQETETNDLTGIDVLLLYQRLAYVTGIYIPDSTLKRPDCRLVLKDSLQQAIAEAVKKAAKQESPSVKWYLIAAAGKNATNLQKFDTENRGTVFGGSAGYYLNRFISIQAGFYAGRKIYFAGPADYTPKPGNEWGRPNIKIIKVDADCYIFDLPLLVRVDVLHNRHNTLYTAAGFSSFITNRENYVYHYNYGTSYQRKAASYKGNVDWFTSADFSIGFEQRVFKPFYLQIEPYAKLPLAGIGEGRVKLYSLGIQLGLKYQPLKRR